MKYEANNINAKMQLTLIIHAKFQCINYSQIEWQNKPQEDVLIGPLKGDKKLFAVLIWKFSAQIYAQVEFIRRLQ